MNDIGISSPCTVQQRLPNNFVTKLIIHLAVSICSASIELIGFNRAIFKQYTCLGMHNKTFIFIVFSCYQIIDMIYNTEGVDSGCQTLHRIYCAV